MKLKLQSSQPTLISRRPKEEIWLAMSESPFLGRGRGEASLIIMAEKDNKTKSFVLRVDAETMAAIEKWAADEFRSTNGQLQWIIAEALKKSGRMKKKKGEAL